MSDPAFALQEAQFAALENDSALDQLVDGRVYDDVPEEQDRIAETGKAFPYVVIGEMQVLGDDTEGCGDGSQVFSRVHVWSRDTGFPECKRISAEVRRILRIVPTIDGFTVDVIEFVQTQYLRDPDGITHHAVIEHRYLISHVD